MPKELTLSLFLIAGITAALAIGSLFPPIVSRSGLNAPTPKEDVIAKQEYTYCRNELDGINCACFSTISGQVLANDKMEFRGTASIDRSALARSQAIDSC